MSGVRSSRDVAHEYSDVALTHLYADNATMQLIASPASFDVILAGNLFGDILSDAASVLTGSIGLPASALLGEGLRGMYEAGHGTALDIAGHDMATRWPASAPRRGCSATRSAETISLNASSGR